MTNPSTTTFEPIDLAAAWTSQPHGLEFILPGLARGTIGNLVAAGGAGKTFLMLATALGVGIGRDVCEIWGETPAPGVVAFLSLEDPVSELARRVWMLRDELSDEEREAARRRVHILSLSGRGVAMAEPTKDGNVRITPWFTDFSRYVIDLAPRLLVVDTLNRMLGSVSENHGGAMSSVLGKLEALAREADCAIVLCHHVSKGSISSGNAGEAHAARGSSVITDNARWQVNLTIPPKDGPYPKQGEERRRRLRLEFTKLNYAAPRPVRLMVRAAGGVLRHDKSALPLEALKQSERVKGKPKFANAFEGLPRAS